MADPSRTERPPEPFQPVAAVLAYLLPGAGHWFLGERKRAILIFLGISFLFGSGLLIGGIDVVDQREDFVWFLGESLVGPVVLGVDWIHQNHFKGYPAEQVQAWRDEVANSPRPRAAALDALLRSRRSLYDGEKIEPQQVPSAGEMGVIVSAPGSKPPNTKSIGRVNELGTLFATIAGMMNLICIIDAAFREKVHRPLVGGGR